MSSDFNDRLSEGSSSETDKILHPLDKAAIQSYMLKFVIPSAAVLSIISAAIGFFVDRIGRNEAYMEAYKELEPKLVDAQIRATTAVTKAEIVVSKMEDSIKQQTADVVKQNGELATLVSSVKQQSDELSKVVQGNFDKVADAIVHKDDFKKDVFTLSQEQLSKINTQLSIIASKQVVVGIDRIDNIGIGASPQTFVSSVIGYEPDLCAITKVEIGNIDSLCRVFKDAGRWQVASGRQVTQLACTATCVKMKYESVK